MCALDLFCASNIINVSLEMSLVTSEWALIEMSWNRQHNEYLHHTQNRWQHTLFQFTSSSSTSVRTRNWLHLFSRNHSCARDLDFFPFSLSLLTMAYLRLILIDTRRILVSGYMSFDEAKRTIFRFTSQRIVSALKCSRQHPLWLLTLHARVCKRMDRRYFQSLSIWPDFQNGKRCWIISISSTRITLYTL